MACTDDGTEEPITHQPPVDGAEWLAQHGHPTAVQAKGATTAYALVTVHRQGGFANARRGLRPRGLPGGPRGHRRHAGAVRPREAGAADDPVDARVHQAHVQRLGRHGVLAVMIVFADVGLL